VDGAVWEADGFAADDESGGGIFGGVALLRSAQAAGSLEGTVVAAKMHAMPVNDFCHDNVPVRANGQVQDPMYVWRVKPAAKSTHKWDFYEPVGIIDGADAYIPVAESGCTLTRS
jgi:branched-chain amino acid transport system substrate-binding protein